MPHACSDAVEQSKTPASSDRQERDHRSVLDLLKILGPGLIAGAADDDPTGIATYAQAGARAGYGLLWTTLLTLPMLATVQFISTKVAVVTRRGLAGVIEDHYPRAVLYPALIGLIVANTINAGADIGAMAAAVNLFLPIPIRVLVVPIVVIMLAFLIFGNFALIENTFKWLTLALVGYIVTSFMAKPDLGAMVSGALIPHITLSAAFLTLVVATLGGNVSPYLMFWQADMEEEGEKSEGQTVTRSRSMAGTRAIAKQLQEVAWDTNIGMVFSNAIIFFIEVSSAETLFKSGHHNVSTAVQAAQALRPLLGGGAEILWAVGMLGAGMLAVPALTGSIADAVASTFGWAEGLNQKPNRAWRFYGILTVATLVSLAINFVGISPIQALVIAAAVNGFLTPPLLILLLLISRREDIMGEHVNGLGLNLLGWGTALIMVLAAIGLVYTLL